MIPVHFCCKPFKRVFDPREYKTLGVKSSLWTSESFEFVVAVMEMLSLTELFFGLFAGNGTPSTLPQHCTNWPHETQ